MSRAAIARTLGWVALAWLPFLVLWGFLNATYFDVSLAEAFIGAASAIGSAALLGFAVWWVSGRLPWPEAPTVSFAAAHFALASGYAAAWIGWGALLTAMRSGAGFLDAVVASPMAGWRFVTGIWLYGMLAGASYAVRIRARLRDQRERALRAEAIASRARLARLRAQLRPHFLFNALHSVSSLMAIDVDEAQGALERLGGMLRYALEEEADLVPLEREWAFTLAYLELESLRLEEGLLVDAELPGETGRVAVPPFCLQSLAENAVRHGIVPKGGGRVTLRAVVVDAELRLSIEDDGVGAGDETVAGATGRGLRLVRESLAARWGESARLSTSSAPGGGFRAELRLPARSSGGVP